MLFIIYADILVHPVIIELIAVAKNKTINIKKMISNPIIIAFIIIIIKDNLSEYLHLLMIANINEIITYGIFPKKLNESIK